LKKSRVWLGPVLCRDRPCGGLSRERVRQIVAQALDAGKGDTTLEHAKAPIARLEPALRLAARGVTEGDLSAIDRLLRVLDRLDKYSAAPGAEETYDENGRERLLTKLNTMAQRMLAARQAGMLDEEGRYRPPDRRSRP